MKIIIEINRGVIKISLGNGKKNFDEAVFPDARDLGEKLLPEVDKMLKKAKLQPKDIQKVEVASDQSDSFTTTRIARTFAVALTGFGKQLQ